MNSAPHSSIADVQCNFAAVRFLENLTMFIAENNIQCQEKRICQELKRTPCGVLIYTYATYGKLEIWFWKWSLLRDNVSESIN